MFRFKRLKKLKHLPNNLWTSFKLLKDPRVPNLHKYIFVGLAAGYAIWPWDFVFDVPLVGQLDDLAVFLFLYSWFMSRIPLDIRQEYGWKDAK